jgi:mycothiol synthase
MLEIRPATTDRDLEHVARIVTTVTPDEPTSVEALRWADAAYPGGQRFLAWLDDEPVGTGGAGRVYMYPPDFEGLWGSLAVLPEYRRHGVGSALLGAISDVTRGQGKTLLIGRTSEDQPESVEFLVHRGFHEHDRTKIVRLPLDGLAAPAVDPPEGVTFTTLAEQPELVAEVYEVAREALPDIPGDGPSALDTLAEFRKRDVDWLGVPHDAFMLALDRQTGHVIGYANLTLLPGNPKVAWHDMTAVARRWRGRGVATALKRATIRWAVEHGLEALETGNDIDNAPMRAVNLRLGYRPRPDELDFRGPPWSPTPAAEAVEA